MRTVNTEPLPTSLVMVTSYRLGVRTTASMAERPADRFPSAGSFAAALGAAVAG